MYLEELADDEGFSIAQELHLLDSPQNSESNNDNNKKYNTRVNQIETDHDEKAEYYENKIKYLQKELDIQRYASQKLSDLHRRGDAEVIDFLTERYEDVHRNLEENLSLAHEEIYDLKRELVDARRHIALLIRTREESEAIAFAAAETASEAAKARAFLHDERDHLIDEIVLLKSELAIIKVSMEELSDICELQKIQLKHFYTSTDRNDKFNPVDF